ncbi:SDR family NAD(P)-dependent oxidoreductase [Haliea sp. E17]|uniref:SDR family NAD(P)-dependent oxidoreductase n=1 Tax=Haliea sp. E17 TaxID=3401576 RepID=UPI003AAC2A37
MYDLKGRVAVVTGGASGIGAAISRTMAEAGAFVVVVDINRETAEAEVATLKEAGYGADAVIINLADEVSVVAGCQEIVEKHGAPWALVNNAGLQDRQLLLEGTVEEWDRMNAVNARGPFLMIRELGRDMVEKGEGGRIVNVASLSLRGQIVKGLACYVGSKGALAALTQASALELVEHGITVNTVLPGGVMTPGSLQAKGPAPEGPACRATPLGLCEGEDIASAVLYFSLPAARRVTNQTLAVDAGFSIAY